MPFLIQPAGAFYSYIQHNTTEFHCTFSVVLMTIGEHGVVWDFCRKCHCVKIHCFERLTVPQKRYIMHLFCAFWCKYFCVCVFCWQIQSNKLQRLFKCEFLSVSVPQMFFTFSTMVVFTYLSSGFMLKNSCLLLLLKPFANGLLFFFFMEAWLTLCYSPNNN